MTGVIVRNKDNEVVDKLAFSGDESIIPLTVSDLQSKNPDFSYEILREEDPGWKEKFDEVSMKEREMPIDPKWAEAKANGTDAALSFIARRLGLE